MEIVVTQTRRVIVVKDPSVLREYTVRIHFDGSIKLRISNENNTNSCDIFVAPGHALIVHTDTIVQPELEFE